MNLTENMKVFLITWTLLFSISALSLIWAFWGVDINTPVAVIIK